jgi:hypothetical protein
MFIMSLLGMTLKIVIKKEVFEKVDALMRVCDELELRMKENKEGSGGLMNSVLREVF